MAVWNSKRLVIGQTFMGQLFELAKLWEGGSLSDYDIIKFIITLVHTKQCLLHLLVHKKMAVRSGQVVGTRTDRVFSNYLSVTRPTAPNSL